MVDDPALADAIRQDKAEDVAAEGAVVENTAKFIKELRKSLQKVLSHEHDEEAVAFLDKHYDSIKESLAEDNEIVRNMLGKN